MRIISEFFEMFENFETIPSETWRAISNLKNPHELFPHSKYTMKFSIFKLTIISSSNFSKTCQFQLQNPHPESASNRHYRKSALKWWKSVKLRGKSVDFVKIFIWKKNFYVDYDILKIWLAWKTSIFWDFFSRHDLSFKFNF